MPTPSTQPDLSLTRECVLQAVRKMLGEIGNSDAIPRLHATSVFDIDLGLRSIERVELLARLETELGARVPDHLAVEAKTPEDLARAFFSVQGDATKSQKGNWPSGDAAGFPEAETLEESPEVEQAASFDGARAKTRLPAARKSHPAVRRAFEIAYGIYFGLVLLALMIPSWLIVLFITDRRAARRFTTAVLKLFFVAIGCPVTIIGKAHMETPGAKIYACNHTSYFDVAALIAGLGVSYRFVAKKEVRRMPFIGTFLQRMGHLWFDRENPRARLRQLEEMQEAIGNGESVFVFPEGTFTPEDGIRRFQLGAFKTSVATGAPIIPVSLEGSRQALRDGMVLPRPTRVTITLSPPIYPRFTTSQVLDPTSRWEEIIRLKNETRLAIARHVDEPIL